MSVSRGQRCEFCFQRINGGLYDLGYTGDRERLIEQLVEHRDHGADQAREHPPLRVRQLSKRPADLVDLRGYFPQFWQRRFC